MNAHSQIVHLCASMIHSTIMLYYNIWKATSHTLIFVEVGFQPQQSFMFVPYKIILSCANIIHNTIKFYSDL